MSNDGRSNDNSPTADLASAPTSAASEPASAASDALAATKRKRKKASGTTTKKGTRKSRAAKGDGATLELTPTASTAAPPVAVAATPPAPAPVAQATEAQAAKIPEVDPDDVSVPPAEDLDHDFFRASEAPPPVVRAPVADHAIEMESRDPRLEALMTAEVKRRRAHFAKYVKAAVAISLVLCLAAVVRVGVRRNHGDDANAMAATSVRQVPVPVVPEPPAPSAAQPIDPPPVSEPAAAPTATASAAEEPAKVEEPAPSASAAASAAPSAAAAPDAPADLDPKAALKEKRKAQQLLDQGKIADAIQHGEDSVKLDPTDAEAWLILGAAYQMKGDQKEARRCFRSCIQEGKRGPKGECMAMPH